MVLGVVPFGVLAIGVGVVVLVGFAERGEFGCIVPFGVGGLGRCAGERFGLRGAVVGNGEGGHV